MQFPERLSLDQAEAKFTRLSGTSADTWLFNAQDAYAPLGQSDQFRLCKGDEMERLRMLGRVASVGVLTAALSVGVLVSPAHACLCAMITEAEHYEFADHVFTGTILHDVVDHQADPSADLRHYAVLVHDVRKGEVPRYVNVTTAVDSAMCGIELTRGADYLIFAFGDSDDRWVVTNLCSGTRLLSEPLEPVRSGGSVGRAK